MLPSCWPRTAALFILVLCAIASWHIALPFLAHESYALSTVSVESHSRQVRDADSITDGSSLATESSVHMKDIVMREGSIRANVGPYPSMFPYDGAISNSIIKLVANDAYHFVANIPSRTAKALMVYTLDGFMDSEIIIMMSKSRSHTVELYPDLKRGYSVADGYCMVEFSIPLMGNHPGIAIMVCLNPFNPPKGEAVFVAKNLPKNTPFVKDSFSNYEFFVRKKAPLRSTAGDNCTKYNYQYVYNELFNEVDDYVYNKLGSYRLIYMNNKTYTLREEARRKFIFKYYNYATPGACLADKSLVKAVEGSLEVYNNFKRDFTNRKVKSCRSNVKTSDYYYDSLLGREELAALRAFDVYGRTYFRHLLTGDYLNIVETRGECIFDELSRNGDLSAEYWTPDWHYVRIEYFKWPNNKGLTPGQLLYVSVDYFGSVDAILFIARPPDKTNLLEYNDYTRVVEHQDQPYFSDMAHIVRAKSVAHGEYDAPNKWLKNVYLSGYRLVVREYRAKIYHSISDYNAYLEEIYKNIYEYTGLDKYLTRETNGDFPKFIDNPDSQKKIISNYSRVKESRIRFLEQASLSVYYKDNTASYYEMSHMAPILFDFEFYNRNTYDPKKGA